MSHAIQAISQLFDRLALIYGAAFINQWSGHEAQEVKELWASELSPFMKAPEVFGWVLDNLPERPPNLIVFKNLCSQAPRNSRYVALPPAPPSNPERARTFAQAATQAVQNKAMPHDPKQWARNLLDQEARGRKLTIAQRRMARAALGLE